MRCSSGESKSFNQINNLKSPPQEGHSRLESDFSEESLVTS